MFTNRFDETLSRIAFTGYGSDSEIALFSSPEFSTNGTLRKAWRKRKDGIFLYKAGTDGFANSGNEPYSEFYACQLLEAMYIPCIRYDLEMWEGRLCSVCKLFTSEEYSLIPASALYERDYTHWLDRIKEGVGDEEVESIKDMIAFDALANNTDRHFNNFGVLQNNETFELEGRISVVYDNGLSLFYNEMERDFTSEYDRLLNETSLFTHDTSFVQISEFIGKRQKDKLHKLINFKFERHPKYNLPEWRLKTLEWLLQERLRIMLSM